MPFTQVQPQAPAPAPLQAPVQRSPFNYYGGLAQMHSYNPLGGISSGFRAPPQAPAQPAAPQYTYTPAAVQPLPDQAGLAGLNAIMPGQDLYSNPQAPWYVPPQQQAAGQGLGGWDSSSFMQGLRALQANLPEGETK